MADPGEIKITEKQTKREKCLVVVSMFLFFIAIIFFILFLVYYFEAKDKDDEKENTCKSATCIRAGASVLENLDQAVDPCDNFYQFACGKYMENNPLSERLQEISPLTAVGRDVQLAVRDELEMQDANAPEAVKKARMFYATCMDSDTIDKLGTAPFLAKIQSFGSNVFPTINGTWVDENWSLNEILSRVPRYHVQSASFLLHGETNPLFTVTIDGDMRKSDQNIITLREVFAPLDLRDIFLAGRNNSFVQAYENSYVGLTVGLGANETIARHDAKDVVDFEIRLIGATLSTIELRNFQVTYTKKTIGQLNDEFPQLDWLEFLQGLFSPLGISLTLEEDVAVLPLSYFEKALPVINETSTRTILNFCMWKFLYGHKDYLPQSIRDLMGEQRPKNRWREVCVPKTLAFFPEVTGRLFVDKHFTETARAKIQDMIGDLKAAFKDVVRETDWMSAQTKQAALEKVDGMGYQIGYPDDLKNDTYLNEKTKEFNVSASMAFENVFNIGADLHNGQLLALRKPVNRNEWFAPPATANAFAFLMTNMIVFPAGFFGKPLFMEGNLESMTFGGVGYVIGHEITHNFDNTGADFDKDGNLAMWWQPEDLRQFDQRGQCMVEQYNKYSFNISGAILYVNGTRTLGENIADNGGLKEAFKAYKKLVEKRGKEGPRLPGLDYSPDQLFFISAAQVWCNNLTLGALISELVLLNHSPNKYRVIGTMQNSKEFSQAFSCKVGSYMNPEKKCDVW